MGLDRGSIRASRIPSSRIDISRSARQKSKRKRDCFNDSLIRFCVRNIHRIPPPPPTPLIRQETGCPSSTSFPGLFPFELGRRYKALGTRLAQARIFQTVRLWADSRVPGGVRQSILLWCIIRNISRLFCLPGTSSLKAPNREPSQTRI